MQKAKRLAPRGQLCQIVRTQIVPDSGLSLRKARLELPALPDRITRHGIAEDIGPVGDIGFHQGVGHLRRHGGPRMRECRRDHRASRRCVHLEGLGDRRNPQPRAHIRRALPRQRRIGPRQRHPRQRRLCHSRATHQLDLGLHRRGQPGLSGTGRARYDQPRRRLVRGRQRQRPCHPQRGQRHEHARHQPFRPPQVHGHVERAKARPNG